MGGLWPHSPLGYASVIRYQACPLACVDIKNAPFYVRSGQDSLFLEPVEEPELLEEPKPVEEPLPQDGFYRIDDHDYLR